MTRDERNQRFLALRIGGCLACLIEDRGYWCGLPEIHHLNKFGLQGHERIGDEATVCLGAWHHRGVSLPGMSRDAMTAKFGPSWAHDKEQFVFAYGNNDQILARQNARLEYALPALA